MIPTKIRYIAVLRHERAKDVINRLNLDAADWTVMEAIDFAGSQKVLPLLSRREKGAMMKIEGPGFVIDELYTLLRL